MKKWWILILILLAAGIGGFYFFQPVHSGFIKTKAIRANEKAFTRTISQISYWKKWWPGNVTIVNNDSANFTFNGNLYTILEKHFSSLLIGIKTNEGTVRTELIFIPSTTDTVLLTWAPVKPSANNPFAASSSITNDLIKITDAIQQFYKNNENIYGLKINEEQVIDSNLISTSLITKTLPAVTDIYALVNKLNKYASDNGAMQTNPPMLNIFTSDSITFKTQVAIPVSKRLKDAGEIHYKWMLGGGNILLSEVKGGYYTINQAFKTMNNYLEDNGRVAPAIQFQSLVTDRRQQPDSAKWITRLYWPVM